MSEERGPSVYQFADDVMAFLLDFLGRGLSAQRARDLTMQEVQDRFGSEAYLADPTPAQEAAENLTF